MRSATRRDWPPPSASSGTSDRAAGGRAVHSSVRPRSPPSYHPRRGSPDVPGFRSLAARRSVGGAALPSSDGRLDCRGRVPDQRDADLRRPGVPRPADRRTADERPDGPGHLRRSPSRDARSLEVPGHRRWDPERNTREFVDAMAAWRAHGLLAFTVNLQGGSPQGYSQHSPGTTAHSRPTGRCAPTTSRALRAILDQADALGMVAIVGYFYFGQDQRLSRRRRGDARHATMPRSGSSTRTIATSSSRLRTSATTAPTIIRFSRRHACPCSSSS